MSSTIAETSDFFIMIFLPLKFGSTFVTSQQTLCRVSSEDLKHKKFISRAALEIQNELRTPADVLERLASARFAAGSQRFWSQTFALKLAEDKWHCFCERAAMRGAPLWS